MNNKQAIEVVKDFLKSSQHDMYEYYIASKEGEKFNKKRFDDYMLNELDDSEFTRREDQAYISGMIDVLELVLKKIENN